MLEDERLAAELLQTSLRQETFRRIETEDLNEFMVRTYAAGLGRSDVLDALQEGGTQPLHEFGPAVAEDLEGVLLPDEATPPPVEHHALVHGS